MNTTERRPSSQSGSARRRTSQDVVYTQAKAFNRKRFLLQLATMAAVVLAVLFGMSLFFKVEEVQISGTVKYDPMQVKEASGISEGDNLLTLNTNRISANVHNLKYIDTVQIGTKLPGTVVIQVTELDVFYAAQDQNGGWWLLSSEGKVVDTCASADAEDHTRILGVQLADPVAGAAAVAYEPAQTPGEDGETKPVTVYAQDKLKMAISVIQNMEKNGFIGTDIAKVDVTDLGDIQLWYGTRFQMLLGDGTDLPKKLGALHQVIHLQVDDHASGILDASFTTWPDEVGHTDFP